MRPFTTAALFMAGLVASAAVNADTWKVNSQDSSFSFLSVKATQQGNVAITEVLNFTDIDGTVSATGEVQFALPLSGLSTGIDIRNERMQEKLFDHEHFPQIQYTANVDVAEISKLAVGEYVDLLANGTLKVLGKGKNIEAWLRYIRLQDGRIAINTLVPIIIDAADFGLDEGIEQLREIAGLTMISNTVPVSFSLIADQQKAE